MNRYDPHSAIAKAFEEQMKSPFLLEKADTNDAFLCRCFANDSPALPRTFWKKTAATNALHDCPPLEPLVQRQKFDVVSRMTEPLADRRLHFHLGPPPQGLATVATVLKLPGESFSSQK